MAVTYDRLTGMMHRPDGFQGETVCGARLTSWISGADVDDVQAAAVRSDEQVTGTCATSFEQDDWAPSESSIFGADRWIDQTRA